MGPFDFFKRNKAKPSHPVSTDDGPWLDSDSPAAAGDAADSGTDTAPADNDSGGDDFDFDID